jgi:hypothetical protein
MKDRKSQKLKKALSIRPVGKPIRIWIKAIEDGSKKILGIRNWKKRNSG